MKENTKNVLLGVLIVGLVAMTVAYAALSTSLRISGTATVPDVTWDIHFANVAVDTANTTIPSTDYNLGTLSNNSATTGTLINGLTATLQKPNDKLTVNFDIVNAGTIDAKVSAVNKHITLGDSVVNTDTADTKDVITYTITCGAGGNLNDELAASTGTSHCTLVINYDDNAMGGVGQQTSQTAGEDQTMHQDPKTFKFDANWTYIQK